MTKQIPKKLLNPQAASDFLGKPVGTLSNWRIRNYGPGYYKIGGSIRYAEDELLEWVEQNRVEPKEDAGVR